MPSISERAWPGGRDAALPAWLGAAGQGPPRFDSVVVRGSGVGALTFAARAARSQALGGRVRIAGPRPRPDRRLVNGCTLRARSLDYLAAALGEDEGSLLEDLFGARRSQAETHVQHSTVARASGDGLALGRIRPFMDAERDGGVLAYGLRNGHLVELLAGRVEALGVPFDGDEPDTLAACRARADGEKPLVVNGSHRPVTDLPAPERPTRFVVASQIPLRRRADAVLPEAGSLICLRRRAGAFDTGVFYPFLVPLTPEADLYGIFYRIVPPAESAAARAEALGWMRRTVEGVADALGADLVDADETRGEAVVPCLPWDDVGTPRSDWLDLHRTYSACTPIITGDGMTRAALAGWLAAEAVLHGEDPVGPTNRSLHLWRGANRDFARGITRFTALTEPLFAHLPSALMRAIAARPDMWATVA